MAEIDRIKRNINSMIEQDAPESDIDSYIESEGVTLDMLRGTSTITDKPLNEEPKTPFVETAKSVGKDIKENWPIYGGATIGGVITGGNPLGAAVGGAAGEAYKQVGQHITGSEEASKTLVEAAMRIGKEGALMGAYEVGGKAVLWTGNKLLAPFKSTLTAEGAAAKEVLDQYMPKETSWTRPISKLFGLKKPGVLPAEATEHYGLDLMNNIAEKSVMGGKSMADYKNIVRSQAIEDLTDDLVNSFGKAADQTTLGSLVADTINTNFSNFKKNITTPLYNKAIELAGKTKISTKSLKEFAKQNIDTIEQIGKIEGESAGDDLIKGILSIPDEIDFQVAKELKSRLMSRVDQFSVASKNAPAIGKAKQLIKRIDNEITQKLMKDNPEAYRAWRLANETYAKGSEKYNNDFLRALIKKADPNFGGEPEKVIDMIFKKGGISTVNKVKKAIGTDSFKELKAWHIQDVISKSMKDELLNGKQFYNRMFGPTGIGEEAMSAIYSPSEISQLKKIASSLETVQKRQASGTGGMLIQLTQAGAIVPLVYGNFGQAMQAGGAAVLLGPTVMSRIMLNPIGAKWLSEGLATIPKSAAHLAAFNLRLTKILEGVSDKEFSPEKEKAIIKRFEQGE